MRKGAGASLWRFCRLAMLASSRSSCLTRRSQKLSMLGFRLSVLTILLAAQMRGNIETRPVLSPKYLDLGRRHRGRVIPASGPELTLRHRQYPREPVAPEIVR